MSWAKLIHKKVQKEAEPSQEPPKGTETEEGPAFTFKEFYPVNPPFGYVGIQVDTKTGKLEYLTIEPTMTVEEKEALGKLKTILMEEITFHYRFSKMKHLHRNT